MKKRLALVLAGLMTLGLIGCGEAESSAPAATETPAATEAPAAEAPAASEAIEVAEPVVEATEETNE